MFGINWSRNYLFSNDRSLNNSLFDNRLLDDFLGNHWLGNNFSGDNWFRNDLLGLGDYWFRIEDFASNNFGPGSVLSVLSF